RAWPVGAPGHGAALGGGVNGSVAAHQAGGRDAELPVRIASAYRGPSDAHAFVHLKTLLGDKYVDLQSPTFGAPWLANDATIPGTIGPELEAVVQSGTNVFQAITPNDLATVVGNLAQGAQGHGEDVRQAC